MTKTYFLHNGAGTHTLGGAFTHELSPTDPADATDAITATNSGGVTSGFYEEPEDTGTTRVSTGTLSVEVNVTVAANSTTARVRALRVNSAGGVEATGAFTATQSTATTGIKTFAPAITGLGTWASTDRLVIEVEVQNNGAHGGAAGPTFETGTTNAEVVVSDFAASLPERNGSGTADLLAILASGAGDVDVEGAGTADLPAIAASGSGTVPGAGFAFVKSHGAATDKTTATSVSKAPTSTIPVGQLVVVRIAFDNTETVDGASTTVTVTDSAGNTYTRAIEGTSTAAGVVGDGSTFGIFISKITTQLTTGSTITATNAALSGTTAKAIQVSEFGMGSGNPSVVATVQDNRDGANPPPALQVTGLSNVEHLWLGGFSVDNTTANINPTLDVTYAADEAEAGTTGGGASTNQTLQTAYRILTNTGDTLDWTLNTSGHYALGLVALEETAGGGAVNGSGTATLPPITASGAGDVDVEGSGTAGIASVAASGAGDVDVEGGGTADLMPIAASGAGDVDVTGSGTPTLPPITAGGAGDVDVVGSGTADLEPIGASGSGTIGNVISGSGTADLPVIAASGAGTVEVSGSGTGTLVAVAADGSGSVEVGGDGAALLSPITLDGVGTITIVGAGTANLPPIQASGSGGPEIEGGLAGFAIIGDTTRPEPWSETERPGWSDGTDRPEPWSETERPGRWDATERPEPWQLTIRPSSFGETERPSFWAETVFVREDRDVALTFVAYGPFTENEIPEALLIRVMKPLKAGGTAPLVIFNQTPAYTAEVSIEDPSATVVTRAAEVMDPNDLPIDYPDDFAAAEEGWVRVAWAAGDFDVSGTYKVQVTLDNTVVLLKSTDVWTPEVNVGPASAVV